MDRIHGFCRKRVSPVFLVQYPDMCLFPCSTTEIQIQVNLEKLKSNRGLEDVDLVFRPVCVMQPFCKVQCFAKLLSEARYMGSVAVSSS